MAPVLIRGIFRWQEKRPGGMRQCLHKSRLRIAGLARKHHTSRGARNRRLAKQGVRQLTTLRRHRAQKVWSQTLLSLGPAGHVWQHYKDSKMRNCTRSSHLNQVSTRGACGSGPLIAFAELEVHRYAPKQAFQDRLQKAEEDKRLRVSRFLLQFVLFTLMFARVVGADETRRI